MIPWTEDHDAIRELVGDFSANELWPRAEHVDEHAEFPAAAVEQLSELGLFGAIVPEAQGGGDGDLLMQAVITEELAGGCATTAAVHLFHAVAIDAVKAAKGPAELLEKLATADSLATVAVHERTAVTLPGAIATKATGAGGEYTIDGSKIGVVSASEAKSLIVVARIAEGEDFEGLGVFLTGGAGTNGVEVGTSNSTLGLRGARIGEVRFAGAAATPLAVGADGPRVARRIVDATRIGISAALGGLARRASSYAVQYASERKAFGRSIDQFEALQLKIADSEACSYVAQVLAYRAAVAADTGAALDRRMATLSRFQVGRSAYQSAKESVQILGGNGYSREYPVERMYRDIETFGLLDGSDDQHRLAYARERVGDS